jgi:hypothetical protein
VVLKAKPQLKAFLREAQTNVEDNVLVLTYGAKHKWHADQVAAKLEELGGIVKNVFGEHFALELIMPDGSKKNSGIRIESPRVESVARASEVVSAVMDSIVVEARIEAPIEAHLEVPIEAHLEAPIEARELPEAQHVTKLETFQDDVVLEPERIQIEPETLAQVMTQRVMPAFVEGGVITLTTSSIPATLEFENLGVHNPEPSLFEVSLSEPGPEPRLLEPIEVIASGLLEMPLEIFPEPSLDSIAVDEDFAPWLETQPSDGLAVTSIEVLEDAVPLEAFGLDLGDLDAPPMQAMGIPALKGHPTYQKMAKLFKHRVREAGLLEVVATPIAETPEITGAVAEESEA